VQITRNTLDTGRGPADWFTGDVLIDQVAAPAGASQVAAAAVHFAPGARTAWHTHPNGQTIWVLEGVGLCQRRGGPDHWHGAAATRFMAHVAIQQADDDGNVVTWGEHVSDEEYGQAPPLG